MLNPKNIKIGIVDLEETGGRKTFTDNFYRCLKKYNYNVSLIDSKSTTLRELNTFDILHFSKFSSAKKIFFISKKVKKIFTIHGWVEEERLALMKGKGIPEKSILAAKLIFWKIVNPFLPFFFDAITYPTQDTAVRNKLKGTVIYNGIFINEYGNIKTKNVRRFNSEIIFITYSSSGGLKEGSVDRVISIVNDLNKTPNIDKKVTLLVFGNTSFKNTGSNHVRYMGYRKDFLEIMKTADIFITAKNFPDLGYVELEAGILGVPIAKFLSGKEEIVDGVTGILAKDDNEMLKKIENYIYNLKDDKEKLGQNLKNYIINSRSWDILINEWQALFEKLLK